VVLLEVILNASIGANRIEIAVTVSTGTAMLPRRATARDAW